MLKCNKDLFNRAECYIIYTYPKHSPKLGQRQAAFGSKCGVTYFCPIMITLSGNVAKSLKSKNINHQANEVPGNLFLPCRQLTL